MLIASLFMPHKINFRRSKTLYTSSLLLCVNRVYLICRSCLEMLLVCICVCVCIRSYIFDVGYKSVNNKLTCNELVRKIRSLFSDLNSSTLNHVLGIDIKKILFKYSIVGRTKLLGLISLLIT